MAEITDPRVEAAAKAELDAIVPGSWDRSGEVVRDMARNRAKRFVAMLDAVRIEEWRAFEVHQLPEVRTFRDHLPPELQALVDEAEAQLQGWYRTRNDEEECPVLE